jgi:hypothetical protein
MWQRDALRRIVAEGKLTDADLKELIEICKAEKMGVSGKFVPVPLGTGTVGEGLPWIGTKVEDRLDKLEKQARAAKDLYDKDEEEKYKNEAIAVYTGLRSTWERTVQEVIFNRVVLRHRDYIEAKKLKKVTALSTTDCDSFEIGYKKCCGIIESHDPSEGRNAGVPSPAELLKDINALKDWVSALRAKQKLIPD